MSLLFRSPCRICFHILPIIGVVLITVSLYGQANNSVIGFVYSDGRVPLAEATVELNDDLHRLVSRVRTDGGGRYGFYRLPLGRYTVKASILGGNYQEQTAEIEITSASRTSSGNETVQQNFTLRLKQSNPGMTGIVFAQIPPDEARKSYEKALEDFKDKKADQGLIGLEKSVSIFPQYYLALERLGEEYILRKKYKEAVGAFLTALEVNPKAFGSHYGLAYSLYELKVWDEALKSVEKALEINPASVNPLFLKGMIFKQKSRYWDAVEVLNTAKKKATSPMPEIFWQLSLIYTNNLKEYDLAADQLESFLKAKPDYAEAEKVRSLIKRLRSKGKN